MRKMASFALYSMVEHHKQASFTQKKKLGPKD